MSKCSLVLVVEDDDSIREVIKEVLQIEGFAVISVCNGKEAIEVLSKSRNPCLIILDLMMPVMNGWEFLKAAKANSAIAAIPIVVASAGIDYGQTVDAERVLKKPIDLNGLLKIVYHYCGSPNASS